MKEHVECVFKVTFFTISGIQTSAATPKSASQFYHFYGAQI